MGTVRIEGERNAYKRWWSVPIVPHVFVAGFMLGVGYMVAIQWYLDRKLNKEIMKEIETLSRNYDNQLKFNWDYPSARWSNLDQDFSENQMKQEHTRND